jgi:hypothetical protein
MKTQISDLRTGRKKVMLNNNVEYSKVGGQVIGSNVEEVAEVWEKVCEENPQVMKIKFFGKEYELKKYNSATGKTTDFSTLIDDDTLREFCIMPSKNPKISGSLTIQGNFICMNNGKKSFLEFCPSFVEII